MRQLHRVCWFLSVGLSVACTKAPATDDRTEESEEFAGTAPLVSSLALPSDAVRSTSGLASKVSQPGRGERLPTVHDKVRVNFTAWSGKGTVSDSSEKRGGPVSFEVTGVVAGWTEALLQMREGEKRRLWIPDALVYPGRPGPPRPLAVFDLELVEIIPGREPPAAPADVGAAPADALATGSGLAYRSLQKSDSGQRPHAWDRVALRYTGWSANGALVEHSRDDQPAVFDVSALTPRWREALQLLSVGERARVWLPETLATGTRAGVSPTLTYDVELVSLERRPEPPRAPVDVSAPPPNASKTPSGLTYQVLRKGRDPSLPPPKASDRVEVQYSAWTTDGTLFDSSVVRGKPAVFPVSRVIPGWAEGLQLMRPGDKTLFWIPSQLAYAGRAGSPQGALAYEVELLRVLP